MLLIGTNDLGAFARRNRDPTDAAADAVRRRVLSFSCKIARIARIATGQASLHNAALM